MDDITDEEITSLRDACTAVHNSPLMLLCGKALRGDAEARARVARIIAKANEA